MVYGMVWFVTYGGRTLRTVRSTSGTRFETWTSRNGHTMATICQHYSWFCQVFILMSVTYKINLCV
jgi:hypothetical protein